MNADALRGPGSLRLPYWLRWFAVAVVAVGILYASLIDPPSSGLAPLGPLGLVGMDKWLHALAYAGLAGALAVALAPGRTSGRSAARVAVLAFLLAAGYGVGIEFAQAPLPERAFSVADVAANATGAGVAVGVWRASVKAVRRSVGSSEFET